MKIYQLKREQILPIDLDTVWNFFSNAANLPVITPSWLKFEVICLLPEKIYPGLMISYRRFFISHLYGLQRLLKFKIIRCL